MKENNKPIPMEMFMFFAFMLGCFWQLFGNIVMVKSKILGFLLIIPLGLIWWALLKWINKEIKNETK